MPDFTWRSLPVWQTHAHLFSTEDVDRSALANSSVDHLRYAASHSDIGALILWDATLNEDGGELAVFTGQSADQERQTLDNVAHMVNTGHVYAEKRVHRHWLRSSCHIEDSSGHLFAVYFVPNNRQI